ncbi:cyclin-dependent kinase C;1 [Actinidia rufa]|uniref:Cyclin-dependent kinase C1 n=1 Tax=Actinidia rufa TaxID=165716 RepID=A0A7J0F6H5_9ERIC|nr:cyclin-dependent kinase C;1 [Actinidia rufa]
MAIAAPGQLNVSESPSWGSRSVDCFEKLEQIGEGTYGQVYMAREIKTGEIVALKKIRMDNEREGFPITAIREIKILKKLHHENVIKLKEIVTSPGKVLRRMNKGGQANGNKYKGGIYMVFEYMDHDLTGLADRPGMRFSVPQIKLGCIFAELLHGKPIFPGKDEPEQLNKIFELCGAPDESNWPGVSKIPWYNNFKPTRPMKRRLREVYRHFDRHALELLERMLTLDPSQRISAKDALDAEYFWTDPLPCDPKSLPKYEASHEFQTKKKRQQQRQHEETAKRQKVQHQQQQHSRLPPTGQGHAQMRPGPNQPMHGSQPPVAAGPSHHYGKPRGPSGGPSRYPQGGNNPPASGAYNHPNRGQSGGGYGSSGAYPPQGRGGQPPYGGSSNIPGGGPRGGVSGYGGVGGPNYPQGGPPYGSSGGGRGSNMISGNRNQQYGWQQ